ncbi:TPA: restriction endonuclease subunit S [Klebsiella pneumoniae]|uniref:restriction endonuclease subunit S n=1 Tax=Klebsiella TaxID=570 RepID=UPI001AEA3A72|nr:restriction endonuclease subunit S [Klebsiella pneumoniae]EIW8570655.1 restriction endonuclease subunit S [Klebsiella pneumoniae]MBP0696005.1 restriction endonuclease subunit S [Klebsiella pneumoniae]MCD9720369.1 restriction endonuclease subunit S [Klebsiella pneumoniae]MCD9741233.1 restriction endonuclease subunit S [Klebsiella pneumoniae]HCI9445863.1 restriction endonuclease subunit S [Klebsiella pneumoniae]
MSQYRAYPAYKDSGVEWIGQVPEHWKVARVKRLASLRNERRNDVSTDTIYIGLEDVEAGSGQYKPTNGSSRQSEDSTVGIFYEGDVLYGKLRPYLRKAIISEMAGCCSTEFLVLRAEKTEPRWLQEWLLTPDVTHQIVSGCEGAKMPRADWGHIGSIEVVYPDQPEQAKILTSLDRETARIDALVEKKTRFIELLKEKRQALITHAVTKGLDPNVKMKDSGVEWIGQVPEHWDVVQSRRLFSERKEWARDDDKQYTSSQKYGVILQTEFMEREGRRIVLVEKGQEILKHIESGDFLISMRSFQGGIEECTSSGCVSSAYVPLRPIKWIWHSFFKYLFKSNTYIQALQRTSDLIRDGQALRFENFSKVPLLHVPISEQKDIALFLDNETARIDALISKSEQSIILLKERRAAFITAAVTGQIDLRGKQ